MHFLRIFTGLLLLVGLAGCGALSTTPTTATPEEAAKFAYTAPGPKSITLYTMINNRTGSGAHAALMISASQRVIFDPAGSVQLDQMPEIGDVLYGITPAIHDWFERSHARSTFHVKSQTIEVSEAVAEQALQLAMANGHVGSAQCAASISRLLRKLPEFETIPSTWFPTKLSTAFGKLPGVTTNELYENDDDDKNKQVFANAETE